MSFQLDIHPSFYGLPLLERQKWHIGTSFRPSSLMIVLTTRSNTKYDSRSNLTTAVSSKLHNYFVVIVNGVILITATNHHYLPIPPPFSRRGTGPFFSSLLLELMLQIFPNSIIATFKVLTTMKIPDIISAPL